MSVEDFYRTLSFQKPYDIGHGLLRWYFQHQMDAVRLYVQFNAKALLGELGG
jgi:hypothetical protein